MIINTNDYIITTETKAIVPIISFTLKAFILLYKNKFFTQRKAEIWPKNNKGKAKHNVMLPVEIKFQEIINCSKMVEI